MARKYANIYTGIWRQEDDFTDLSVHAQWAYMMLVSQPDISAAGVLSINLRRWTRRAKDSSRDLLVAALKELGEAKKIVYDQETEELLVRTFVKWDGGYGNPKRQPVIRRAAQEIESLTIRQALAGELTKLGFTVEGLTDSVPDSLSSQPDSLSGSQREPATAAYVAGSHRPSDQGESSQPNSLSGTVSASDGVVVTQGLTDTATRTPQAADPPPVGGAGGGAKPKAQRSDRGTRLPPDWQPDDSLLAWFREKKLGNVALSSLIDLETETELFRNHWLAKSGAGATKCDWGRTYQNWLLNSAKRAQRFPSNGARASPGRHQAHQNNPNADYNEDL